MREIVHLQAGQCGNQIGAKVGYENTYRHPAAYYRPVNRSQLNVIEFKFILVAAYVAALKALLPTGNTKWVNTEEWKVLYKTGEGSAQ